MLTSGSHDLAAADTDEVGVRIGLAPVVAVVVVVEAQLQDLAQVLEQVQRLVDGPQAGGWELGMELVVQVGGAGMPVAAGQEAQQGDALRRQPALLLPEPADQCLEPGLWIDHPLASFSLRTRENRLSIERVYPFWEDVSNLEVAGVLPAAVRESACHRSRMRLFGQDRLCAKFAQQSPGRPPGRACRTPHGTRRTPRLAFAGPLARAPVPGEAGQGSLLLAAPRISPSDPVPAQEPAGSSLRLPGGCPAA